MPESIQYVDVAEFSQNIQNAAGDNSVFMAETAVINTETPARILMSVPYSRAAETMGETIVAYHIGLNGETELVITSMYDESESVIRLLGLSGELYMTASNPVSFTDVLPERWYHQAISFVAARELFIGVGNNQFAPQSTMTRAMFITGLSRLDGINSELFHTSPFIDVNIESWYGTAITWAMEEGIIDSGILYGGAADTFRPNDNIMREEMAVIFANYLAIRDFPLVYLDVPLFYDLDQASPWTREAIQAMRSHSIINGIGGNLYNPKGYATRAEVSQIFTNLIKSIIGVD